MRKLLLLLILLPVLSVCSVAQSIIINEVSPANSFQEENGGNSDWIELYNSSSEAISLKDWAITDNKTQLQKTQLPDYLLGAQEYMLISASGTEPNQQASISNICNEPPNVINRQSAGIPANFKDELNTRFLSNKVIEKIQANAARIQREMFKHNSRWRRQGQSQWEDRISNMGEFAEKRPAAFRSHIQEQFELPAQREVQINIEDTSKGQVQLNSLLLTTNNWSGIYFESVPVTLTALPKSGYAFDKWSGSTDTTAATIVIDPDQGLALTAHFKKETVLPAVSTVIFNEINYNSSEEKDAGDWIELYNNGPTQQDLSNWVFKDSKDENSFLFPQGTIIDSKGYLVLTGTTSKFEQQFPLVTPVIGEFDFKLSSDGEFIRLYDERNRLVDSLWYLPTDNWPTAANGEGPTLELIDPDTDNTLSSNWTTFPFNGTPSAPNGNYTTATFTLEKENLLTITPNPFSEELTLNFLQNAPELTIQLLDVNGQFIKDLFAKKQYPTQQLTLKMPELANGLYWLRINLGAQQIVRKIIKH